ncbi:hypothetical protein jhhlp_000458 [Lomentospora prolificans]|uniref:Carrier domain-containing protein n=1 Tax=Lomentospora prolificans TaxID=41688 RepID=A0A2N3NKW7_9PEZI|nr:hypothetical protein jhhlp_000458 [Lomentospora prolificans]
MPSEFLLFTPGPAVDLGRLVPVGVSRYFETAKMATDIKRLSLPRIDTTMNNTTTGESLGDKLVTAISKVLIIPRSEIQLYDSFTDLGGSKSSAITLTKAFAKMNLVLGEDDILECRTIAELQTCIRPAHIATHEELPKRSSSRGSDNSSSEASETFSNGPEESTYSPSLHSPTRPSSRATAQMDPEIVVTEELLTSTSQVPLAAVIRPKAGYLEGKVVAFLIISGVSSSDEGSCGCTPELIPQSHQQFAGSHIAALRMLLQNSTAVSTIPDAWVVLEQMPLVEDGGADRRKLQTWIQNINEETHRQLLNAETQVLYQEPATDAEKTLQRLISRVLKMPVDRVGMNLSFRELGGDEFSALQLVAVAKGKGFSLSADEVIQSDSVAHLAFLAAYTGHIPNQWAEEINEGAELFRLSPMQQLYFKTPVGGNYEARTSDCWNYRFNQSMLLKIRRDVALEDVHAAMEAVVGHHSMLRARYHRVNDDSWMQKIVTNIPDSYRFGHHIVSTNDDVLDVIRQAQSFIDIEAGPVFAAEYIKTVDAQHMLYIVAHHLVIDLISWRVIIHDINELLQNGSLYSERSMPFQRWNELQWLEIQKPEYDAPMNFGITTGDFAFWGLDATRNTYGDVAEVSFALAPELTALLQTTCNQAFRTDSTDIYLATLLLSFCQTFPERRPPVIWNQEHGREPWTSDLDIAETIGWFTTLCPLWLETDGGEDLVNVLRRMKDTRRSIPRRGWAYFTSRFLGPNAQDFQSRDWPFEIMFTYGGSLQQLEAENGIFEQLPIPGRAIDSAASDIGPNVGRIALFEVSTMVDQGIAKIKFLYNKETRYQDRIATWISNYEHLLLEAIGRLRYRSQELTLADVPLLNANYDGLSKLNSDRLMTLNISSARDIENVFPATPIQQEILIAQSLAPNTCNLHVIFELTAGKAEAVDSSKICTAWQQTVAKYPALRTVFIESVSEDGLFDAVILRKCSPEMLFIEAELDDHAVLALNTLPPLKSSKAEPRHRLSVCNTEEKTFLKLEISQAICDMLSIDKITSDLKRSYMCNKVSPRNLELSYPQYLESLKAIKSDEDLEFWTSQLSGFKPCLFPALWSGNAEGKQRTTTFKFDISAADLDLICHPSGIKRSTILRVAWGLVLRAYTGERKVCFGFRHSGRDLADAPAGIATAVGGFETELICSMDLLAHRSLESVIQTAEDNLTQSLPHQFTPVSDIEHALGLKGKHLYNTTLSFLDEPKGLKSRFNSARAPTQLGCSLYYNSLDRDISVCVMVQKNGDLEVTLNHRILTGVQGDGIANAFGCAIKAVLNSPNGSVGGVDLFSARDMTQLPAAITAAADSGNTAASEKAVHELVEVIAKCEPHASAIASWDGQLSYRQMSKLIARLAHYLVKLGVEPGMPVPIILGKSRWSAVAILAVLKAGGCFVPLDEDDESFAHKVIRQIGAKIVLAMDMGAKRLESMVEGLVIVNDSLFSASLLAEKECPKVNMGNPACMLFLSPSPSRSKEARGIFFTHEALSTALVAQGPALGIDASSRVFQLSSFASDTSLSEILTTLICGGCVCIPSASDRVHDLAGAMKKLNVDWTYITPVLARRLKPAQVPSIQTICFRTRHLDEDTFNRWSGQTKVLLSYGTSDICPLGISVIEATNAEQLSRIAPPFIGKFWIVNPEDHRHLMPIGAVGELVIESPTLAYKLMKDYTPVETLRAQQVSDDDGVLKARFFKTGHRVRYMNDGTMELIANRRDDLSLNGNVIPVPAVEKHLRRCLGIDVEVVVDTVLTKDNSHVLTAFVELGEHFCGMNELSMLSPKTKERAFMAKRLIESYMNTNLPSYMMPPAVVPIRTFPMTPSLKIHRRKLQKMASGLTEAELVGIASSDDAEGVQTIQIKPLPLTQVEERMRAIWADLLQIDPMAISGTQSFLRLGGDMHLVAKAVVACRKEGLVIRLGDILSNTSLTDLCQSITLSEEPVRLTDPEVGFTMSPETLITLQYVRSTVAPAAGISESSIVDVALATSTQVRALESNLRGSRGGINHVVLNFTGFVDYKKIELACNELIKVHPILRTSFVTHDRQVYQIVTDGDALSITKLDCPSRRVQAVVEKVAKKDEAEPITLSAPFTKFTFVDGGKNSALLVRLSTAQYDESSIPLLVHDLKRIYSGSQNTSLQRSSFADFARQATATSSQGAVDHWAALLEGATITQVIANTKPQKLSMTPRTLTKSVRVPFADISELGITFDTVLKGAWAMVLASLAGTSDVAFGEVIDGRHVRMPTANGVAGVWGPLSNIIPVRVRFPDAPSTPLDLLKCLHEQRLASIPFENMGMYEIVEKCTSWPYWSRFSTVVQHRYRNGLGEAQKFNIGGATCHVSVVESQFKDVTDMFVSSMQSCADLATVSITFCENRVPVSFAELAISMLVSTIESLTAVALMTEPSILSGVDLCHMTRQIPLPQVDFDPTPTPQSHLLSPSDLMGLKAVISAAWTDLLDPVAHGVPEPHLATASFYDLWGSLIPAHLLATRLTSDLASLNLSVNDLTISMDEVIDNPSQIKQLELLARKIRDPHRTPKSATALMRSIRRLSTQSRTASVASTQHTAISSRSGGSTFVSPIHEDAEVTNFGPAQGLTLAAESEAGDGISPLSPLSAPMFPRLTVPSDGFSSAANSPSTPQSQSKVLMRRASKVLERMSRLSSIHYGGGPVVPSSAT